MRWLIDRILPSRALRFGPWDYRWFGPFVADDERPWREAIYWELRQPEIQDGGRIIWWGTVIPQQLISPWSGWR